MTPAVTPWHAPNGVLLMPIRGVAITANYAITNYGFTMRYKKDP
jgi:hypothetical protein